jgi:hypothetical protein
MMEVVIDPCDVPKEQLRKNLMDVCRNALNNGTITGDSAATVEKYDFSVEEIVLKHTGSTSSFFNNIDPSTLEVKNNS